MGDLGGAHLNPSQHQLKVSEKDFRNHLAPCKDYNNQRPDGITYCSWKRNPAFTSKRHLIYGAPPLDHPL